jgi:signal transduction histidine kinase
MFNHFRTQFRTQYRFLEALVLSALGSFFRSRLQALFNLGINAATPIHLVDRIVFANFFFFIFFFVDLAMGAVNFSRGYFFLFYLNVIYFLAILVGLFLTMRGHFLAGRLFAIPFFSIGIFLMCAVQGTSLQAENYFLVIAVLSIAILHASERRFSLTLFFLNIFLFLFFLLHQDPLFDLRTTDPIHHQDDLLANQISFVVFFSACLLSLTRAYDRSLKIVDFQRGKNFAQNRLSTIGSLACNMAHEINSPLSAAELHLQQLKTELMHPPAASESIIRRIDSIQRINSKITFLLQAFKFLSLTEPEDFPTSVVVDQLVNRIRHFIEGKLVTLDVKLEVDPACRDARLDCRETSLSQVLLHLIENSIDSVSTLPIGQRWIKIRTEKSNLLRIIVTDSGKISPQVASRLFETFFTTKPVGRGIGLGLASSREMLERQGGKIWFNPEAPTTEFVIEMPLPEC